MKTLFTIIVLLISVQCFGQHSVGLVSQIRDEIRIKQHYRLIENNTIYYGVGYDYTVNNSNVFFEVLHLEKEFSNTEYEKTYGPHGSAGKSEALMGKAKLNYLALKLGVRYFNEREKFSFLIGANIQNDFVYSYREYDKSSELDVYNGAGYTTYYSDAADYDVVVPDSQVFSASASIAIRVPIKDVIYFEMGINGGFLSSPRIDIGYSGNVGESKLFYGADLKLAYLF